VSAVTTRSFWAIFAAGVATASLAAPAAAGTLPYNIKLEGHWKKAPCRVDNPLASCFDVDYEEARWPGLGLVEVHEYVVQSGILDESLCESQTRDETIITPRGTIELLVSGTDCPATRQILGGYRAVVAEGPAIAGTGAFAGVVGAGDANVRPDEDEVYTHFQGTLSVPSLEFDTTPPVLTAVPRPRTVRAAQPVAVRYPLPTAADAVDGPVAVRCTPASGSRFRMGRTIVRCEANDASGNTGTASFAVTVGRGRR
jgi:hypothetical protein